MCELGVAVGDVGLLGGQSREDITQAAERLVDGAGLLLVLALHLRPGQPLTAPTPTTLCQRVPTPTLVRTYRPVLTSHVDHS